MSAMKFIAQMNGKEHVIVVDNHDADDGYYTMVHGGKTYHVDAQLMKSHIVSMLIDNRSYDVDIERTSTDPLDGSMAVRVRGRDVRFDMLDERRVKMKAAALGGSGTGGDNIIKSPMPGKVVKILVSEGDRVEEGQGVIVVEAMKMENELRASIAGTVRQIATKEGETVDGGNLLLVIEGAEED